MAEKADWSDPGGIAVSGGAVKREPGDIPGIGRFAVVADPQGATFMLFVEGYAWLFAGAQLLQPGAFVVPAAAVQEPLTWVKLLFLSATNMSATGLTDIYPATPHARVLVIVEQWNGVMYLTVVVARMAGLLRRR